MTSHRTCFRVLAALLAVSGCAVHAGEFHIYPGDSFEAAVEDLSPGDTLIVHEGTFTDTGRISIGVKGTATSPVTIQAADGEQRPLISRLAGASAQNTINIEGAEHLTIKGLEISSNGGDGVNLSGNPSHIVLEDLVIHDVSVGVNLRSDMHHITVRSNHIYATNDTGEGMYVGCNHAACVVSNSTFERNWIHDTHAATQGDGIEIKKGSHSNLIRDNVIHDTNYPCILLYGTEGNPRNVVEGNVMWNCGDSGIQAAADSIIRNNIILESPDNGFNSQSHQGVTPANLEFLHNTVIGGNPCLRINAWDDQPGLVFANNAVYCASGNYAISGLRGVTVSGNVFEPAAAAIPTNGSTAGRSESLDFIDVLGKDVYPTLDSALLSAGNSMYVTQADFNGTQRLGGIDAGAYAWTDVQNPGWQIAAGFKDGAMAPSLELVADPAVINIQDMSTLTWSSANTDACQASGDWSGDKPVNGNEEVGPLAADSTFTLTCTGPGGSSSESVSVIVQAPAPAPPPAGDDDPAPGSGGGSATWLLLIALSLAIFRAVIRMR